MHQGFGLLEVLVALALIALATLGIVNGLSHAFLHALESKAFAHATLQAQNIYERAQANPLGFKQGAYFQIPGSAPNCNPCSPAQQASKDLARWQEQLSEISGEGEILPNGEGVQIIIRWPSVFEPDVEWNEWILYGS